MRVLPLDDAAATLEVAGGKGASLARLARAGLPVPAGFHITTDAYREFVAPFHDRILASLDEPAAIAALFAEHEMPDETAKAVREAYAALGDDVPVAVRSSATAEDLPGMSFAGQQDTYLNVRGDALLDAVRRCWASLWTERAIAYRGRNDVSHGEVALAVVVQELVAADAAGVMFTANPVNGARDEIVVNAAWGLGEAVVGGQVTPDTLVVKDGAVTDERVADKTVMTVRTGSGTREEPVPEERRRLPVLDGPQAVRLAELGTTIERLYCTPMDVEWAMRDGELFVLQARPVTGLQQEVEEWNDSRKGDYLWTAGNLGEAIPDVMTPATWSFVRIFIHEAMSASALPGFDLVGNIGGRFYMNLSLTVSIAKALGMGSRLSAVEQVFGKFPPGLDIPLVKTSRWKIVKLTLPMAFRIRKRVKDSLATMPAFLATARRRNEELRATIEAAGSGTELAQVWEGELLPYLITACRMLEAAGRQGGATLVWTRDKLRKMMGETDAEAMLTGVNADGSGELASLGPIIGLDRLAKGEITREEFALAYGHRGPHEFEVSRPRPGEDPEWIDAQLAGLSTAQADTGALLARQAAARDAAWARFAQRHPGKEAAMRARIARWNAVVRDRETTRSEVIRAFWALRAFVLRAGELTGHGDDLFFLPVDEILSVLRGAEPTRVAVRRATYERYAALPPYPTLIVGYFDPVRWAASPDRRADLYDARGISVEVADAVTGFPGAPGVVEGVARVIAGPEEGERLKQGEILVTTLTNIGWTPMFPRAAAVVTDMGAPLSHASIVARELGIPAVVGTGNATMRIKDGDRVRVDGEKGTVEVLPS
ncbi:PEP/pyruvate-binding domain-containing protein [Nonomuraea sp. NPDC049152]|uniref:PEP/pyruvate-binding domain-containing protein n=1 Tax=Nonomuraea sp. NPDC049152 TaxID=3154350 RepID=UPI0033D96F74